MPVAALKRSSSYYFFDPRIMTEDRFNNLLSVCQIDLGVGNCAAMTNPEEFDRNVSFLKHAQLKVKTPRNLINQKDLVERLLFAQSIQFPYFNKEGIIFPEMLEREMEKSPLKGYFKLKDNNSNESKMDIGYYSAITAKLNQVSVEKFNQLLAIDENTYNEIEKKYKENGMDLSDVITLYESFELLSSSNPFVDLKVFDEDVYTETDDPTNGFMRSGQR